MTMAKTILHFQSRLGGLYPMTQFAGPADCGDERRCLQIGDELRISRADADDLIANIRAWADSIDESSPKWLAPDDDEIEAMFRSYKGRENEAGAMVVAVLGEMMKERPEEMRAMLSVFAEGFDRFLVRLEVPEKFRKFAAEKLAGLLP